MMKSNMATDAFVVVVEIPEHKCPRVRNRDQLIKDGKAQVYLSINTSKKDALNGITRYGVSGGRCAFVVTDRTFPKVEAEIKSYLNERFGSDWSMELVPLKR